MKQFTAKMIGFFVAITLGTSAFAQDSKLKLTVIKDDPMLELQTAEMSIQFSDGIFSAVTGSSLKFALDLKNEREIFKASFVQGGKVKYVDFIVQEADVDGCGIKTYRATATSSNQGRWLLIVTDTPPECSGFIPEPIWSAQLVSTLGQTGGIDGELKIFGTPKVIEQ